MPYEQAIEHIHPQDKQRVDQAVAWAINPLSDGVFDQTYRTLGVDDAQLRWVRFWGRSYFSSSGELTRFGGMAQDVTEQVLGRQQLERTQQQLLTQFEQAPVGIATISGEELTFRSANPFYGQIVGRSPEQLVGRTLFEVIPEVRGLGFETLLRGVLTSGQPYTAQEVPAQLIRQGRLETAYFTFTYQPHWLSDDLPSAILMIATEVTSQVVARQQVEASEAKLNLLSDTVPSMIFYLDQQQRYQSYNRTFMDWFGVDRTQVIGQTVREFLGEKAYQVVAPYLAVAYGGNPVRYEMQGPAPLAGERWLDITYTPHRNEAGEVLGVIVLAVDISEQIQARESLQASEARFRSLIEQSPAAIGLFVGRDLRIEMANELMIAVWGKGASVLGKPLIEALPELVGQPFLALLDQVYATGVAYTGHGMRADLVMDGELKTHYFDFTYQPIHDADGRVYAIMDLALDVTQEFLLHQRVEQGQQSVQNAVDLAQLGIWKIDVTTQKAEFSPLVNEWVGSPDPLTLPAAVAAIDPDDLPAFNAAFSRAYSVESGGKLDVEYRLKNVTTGRVYLLHSVGQMYFDPAGKPALLQGFSRDITAIRALQLTLESQVHERTQDLLLANQDLKRSNDNLQQFAYVASHDLQEPLRKIQSFSTLLEQQAEGQLTDLGRTYLQRITGAAARMSGLIKDLLSYSRIATRQQIFGPISLNAVMANVVETLSLEIEQRQAQLQTAELPIVNGDPSQLGQLFQNLFSNALKFTPQGQPPQIKVEYFCR